jgi:hypothetical protein
MAQRVSGWRKLAGASWMLTITATFDHRYADGYHAARFAEAVRGYCADPARFEPARPGDDEQSQDQVRSSGTGS